MKRSPSRVGDIAEHYAVTWLWDNDYEVFMNCGCDGPIDIVAVSPQGEVKLIDVKTQYPTGGTKKTRTELQKELGVVILKFDPTTRKLEFVKYAENST